MADEHQETKTEKVNGTAPPDLSIPLRKLVQASGEELKELKFREPTASDIEICGNPVILDLARGGDVPKINFDAKSMSAMMSRLAAVPPSTIRQLHPKDWNTAAWMLANFFVPDL